MTQPNKPERKPKHKKAKFKVGQVVRIIREDGWPNFLLIKKIREAPYSQLEYAGSLAKTVYFFLEHRLRPLTKRERGE